MKPTEKLVVIGASAGGIEALKQIITALPADLPAAILVVQHTGPATLNVLDRILSRDRGLPVTNALDGEEIRAGHCYVAPADRHLLVAPDRRLQLSRGPKENRFRPAIDPLFRSAAAAFGSRVIGVVLTGWLDDGTAGLWAIKQQGGIAVVQNPEDAIAPDMPLNALKHVEVNHCARLGDIAPLLVRLARPSKPERKKPHVPKLIEAEIKIAAEDNAIETGIVEFGEPSVFACPECHGVLLQLKEGGPVRFRCHTGHAYSLESLLAEFAERADETLWNALRALEETEMLLLQMAQQLREHRHASDAVDLQRNAEEWKRRAALVRQAVMSASPQPSVIEASRQAVAQGS